MRNTSFCSLGRRLTAAEVAAADLPGRADAGRGNPLPGVPGLIRPGGMRIGHRLGLSRAVDDQVVRDAKQPADEPFIPVRVEIADGAQPGFLEDLLGILPALTTDQLLMTEQGR